MIQVEGINETHVRTITYCKSNLGWFKPWQTVVNTWWKWPNHGSSSKAKKNHKMILHPCSIIVNTPPKKKCKQTLRRIIIFGGSPGQCGPCGPCLQPASRWQGPEGHVARTTLGRSCGPPRLNWMVTTGNIYRKQWLFSGSKMDFVWILINGSYPNMIK